MKAEEDLIKDVREALLRLYDSGLTEHKKLYLEDIMDDYAALVYSWHSEAEYLESAEARRALVGMDLKTRRHKLFKRQREEWVMMWQ
jgi:hypothetical protein